jgi:hypothetical protein
MLLKLGPNLVLHRLPVYIQPSYRETRRINGLPHHLLLRMSTVFLLYICIRTFLDCVVHWKRRDTHWLLCLYPHFRCDRSSTRPTHTKTLPCAVCSHYPATSTITSTETTTKTLYLPCPSYPPLPKNWVNPRFIANKAAQCPSSDSFFEDCYPRILYYPTICHQSLMI